MKETILQYVREYAPTVIMLVMMFIFKFGFGKNFDTFRSDVTSAFNVKNLTGEINDLKSDLLILIDENRELQEEINALTAEITKIKKKK